MNNTVADAMTTNPTTVEPDTALKEAITIMAEQKISGLPVLNKEGKLVGVISETDLMWQETGIELPLYINILDSLIYLRNPARYEQEIHKALGQTVGEVMSDKPISISPNSSLREAARIMHEKKIRRLPAIDDSGKLVGIITRGDIVKFMASETH